MNNQPINNPIEKPPLVLISYSHQDEPQKAALLSHLGVLANQGLMKLWLDDQIAPGADWKQEISHFIAQAKIAILIITANYLASDVIQEQEIPALLQRRQNEGLIVFPIIAKPCAWQAVHWLSEMQVRPQNRQAIWREDGRYADEQLAAIAQEVATIVRGETAGKAEPALDKDKSSTLDTAGRTSLQRRLENYKENLRLIEERIAEYVEPTDVPLTLLKNRDRIQQQIDTLSRQLNSN